MLRVLSLLICMTSMSPYVASEEITSLPPTKGFHIMYPQTNEALYQALEAQSLDGFLGYVTVTFSEEIKTIPGCFKVPASVKKLTVVGSDIETIESNFLNNSQVLKVDLSSLKGLKKIESCSLSNNDQIQEIILPGSLEGIGDYFLNNCPSLKGLRLAHLNNLTSLGDGFAMGAPFSKCDLSQCSKLETIGGSFFQGSKLEEIIFPSSIKEINSWCLGICPHLKKIDLSGCYYLKIIGGDFAYNSGVMEVILPNSPFLKGLGDHFLGLPLPVGHQPKAHEPSTPIETSLAAEKPSEDQTSLPVLPWYAPDTLHIEIPYGLFLTLLEEGNLPPSNSRQRLNLSIIPS